MKLPKSRRNAMRELDRVIEKALKTVGSAGENSASVKKETFESLLDSIILQIAKNRRLDANQVAAVTSQVIAEMSQEYGQLADEQRSWETFIAFIYVKYQQVLGIDTSMFTP